MTGGLSLLKRRAEAMHRIEYQRGVCSSQYRQFTASTKKWAGSPQSIVQAFLAGIVMDQTLAILRYPMRAQSIVRPLSDGLRTLERFRSFF